MYPIEYVVTVVVIPLTLNGHIIPIALIMQCGIELKTTNFDVGDVKEKEVRASLHAAVPDAAV